MSYNVLSQTLMESDSNLFEKCDPSHLTWEARFSKIFTHINNESPDILCLQEVDVNHRNLFTNILSKSGYYEIFKKKTGVTIIDGCAIYVNSDAFEQPQVTEVEFYQPKVSLLEHNHVGIIVRLRPYSMPNTRLVVANTHLLYDPRKAVIRLAQLRLFLAEIDRVSYEFNGQNSGHMPIILTGDFNSHPYSTIVELLEVGQVSKNKDWDDMEWRSIAINDNCQHLAVYLNRVQGLPTQFEELQINNSTYGRSNKRQAKLCSAATTLQNAMHNEMFTSKILSHTLHFISVYDTNSHNKLLDKKCSDDEENGTSSPKANVDYVFYNARSGLRPLKRLSLADVDQFPNEFSGSDHQSLVVIFELNAEKPY